jgi:hypothetical protein
MSSHETNDQTQQFEPEVISPADDSSLTPDEGTKSRAVVRRGTGPRTKLGKAKSRSNATKHGIFSNIVTVGSESPAQVRALLRGLRDHFQPQGALEELLVDKLTALMWRHRRLMIAAVSVEADSFYRGPRPDLLLAYELMMDRAIDRILDQLERAQRTRRAQDSPPIDLSASPT